MRGPCVAGLLEHPLALLRRQPAPDVEQRRARPRRGRGDARDRGAACAHIARSRYFLRRLAASAAIVFASTTRGLARCGAGRRTAASDPGLDERGGGASLLITAERCVCSSRRAGLTCATVRRRRDVGHVGRRGAALRREHPSRRSGLKMADRRAVAPPARTGVSRRGRDGHAGRAGPGRSRRPGSSRSPATTANVSTPATTCAQESLMVPPDLADNDCTGPIGTIQLGL